MTPAHKIIPCYIVVYGRKIFSSPIDDVDVDNPGALVDNEDVSDNVVTKEIKAKVGYKVSPSDNLR